MDLPVKLGLERQLFLDNYLIAKAENVSRQVHQPKRHPDNPVFQSQQLNVEDTYVLQLLQYKHIAFQKSRFQGVKFEYIPIFFPLS